MRQIIDTGELDQRVALGDLAALARATGKQAYARPEIAGAG